MPTSATVLLRAWKGGDPHAFDELVELFYDELRKLASRAMIGQGSHHTLQPTALVHEAYVRLAGSEGSFGDRAHFLAAAATVMRRILIDHARSRGSAKRGGGHVQVTLNDARLRSPTIDRGTVDMIALDDALERLGSESPRRSRVIELRYFGGLTLQESADVLGISVGSAHRDLKLGRAWLRRELTA
jgi:RNA polymerase sigma factor (TIGR02999 family)